MNFKEQWKGQWVIISLTVIGLLLAVYFRVSDQTQYSAPLFKYVFDTTTQTISIEPGNDFSPVALIWMIPGVEATSTGISKNELTLNDITQAIMVSENEDQNYSLNPFDKNASGYLRCVVLNEPTVESTSTLEGFPIGVETRYIVKGENILMTNYDLLLLRDLDYNPIQVYTIPNVSYAFLKEYLLKNGNAKISSVMKEAPYATTTQYLGTNDFSPDSVCQQNSSSFLQIPLSS